MSERSTAVFSPACQLSPLLGRQSEAATRWFAVFTFARHEKRAVAHCEQRRIDAFLPLYAVSRRWKNRCTVKLELPLFPCYFFVRIERCERVRVLNLPGVISLVSSGPELLPVPDNYIASLRAGLLSRTIEPHENLEVGDRVRIVNGPMSGCEGILERRKNGLRVVLRLEIIDRSVSVEVGTDEIEPAVVPRAPVECQSLLGPVAAFSGTQPGTSAPESDTRNPFTW